MTSFPIERTEVTPLRDGDEVTVQTVFDGMSPEARFHRFLQMMPTLRPQMRRMLANTSRPGHMAWVARDGHTPLGIVRIGVDADGNAELSVSVVDKARRRGVGRLLVEHARRHAAEAGFESLGLLVHPSNVASRELFRSLGVDFELDEGLLVGRLKTRAMTRAA